MLKRKKALNQLVSMAMLAAISIVLVALIRIPMFIPFLVYDPADVPILIGGLIFGPAAGLMLTIVVSAIQALIFNPESGVIGFIMHSIATGGMSILVALIYRGGIKRKRDIEEMEIASKMSLLAIALAAGAVFMVISMIPMNLLLTPIYTKMAAADIWKQFMFSAIIPFNLVKATINCVGVFILYPLIMKVLKFEKGQILN